MNTNLAISVKALSKRYRIGEQVSTNDSLAQSFMNIFVNPIKNFQRLKGLATFHDEENTIWAVEDVTFDVPMGQSIGLIGKNGSGKSTLLKMLSRVAEPTSGEAKMIGRTASLLEVGTGFHPELTGRDNVFLNGAVLGMARADVLRQFDEIVEFSGVGRFIDTPVKRYSSGMKVRLGFAVAAHLETDILLVDEVLAVGDAEFQKRCLNKMDEVGGEGRTVVFVSHHMPSVARLCSRCILLDSGRLIVDGETPSVIRRYSEQFLSIGTVRSWANEQRPGDDLVRLNLVAVSVAGLPVEQMIDVRDQVEISLSFDVFTGGKKITPAIHVFDGQGSWVFASIDIDPEWHGRPRPAGKYSAKVTVPGNIFAEGTYTLGVSISSINPMVDHLFETECVAFSVFDPVEGDSARGQFTGVFPGALRPKLIWENEYSPS